MIKKTNNKDMKIKEDWKKENKIYLRELQKFLDKAENIENEELKNEIIIQMLKCDEQLTKMAEQQFKSYYEQGKKCLKR